MRISANSLLLALLVALTSVPATATPMSVVDKPTDAVNIDTVTVAPHRALYEMSLTGVKNGSTITDVSGSMMFEWADACDGWTVQQNMHLDFTHAEGGASTLSSNEVTWESKDGKHYNFNIRRLNDGKETENYRGKANIAGTNSKAVYSIPDSKNLALTDATLFPTFHTRLVIANAKAGQRFFSRYVFDGSDENGAEDVSVFISPSIPHAVVAGADDKLESSPLLAATEWPIHMAFFKPTDTTGAPDYEMDMKLLANGVVRTIKIDYGDFSVTGKLKALEPLPSPHC